MAGETHISQQSDFRARDSAVPTFPRACWKSRTSCPGASSAPVSRGYVSIPPTVSIRSRSWKTARSEGGGAGRGRKKTGGLVRATPPAAPAHGTQDAGSRTRRQTDTGGARGRAGGGGRPRGRLALGELLPRSDGPWDRVHGATGRVWSPSHSCCHVLLVSAPKAVCVAPGRN